MHLLLFNIEILKSFQLYTYILSHPRNFKLL